ncbi:MAG: UvrD-helicase domain-containing protein, partial [Firmicutes bacterium]|nr:UvrD-helicase domain-containing protein [Bacillota bacterium]
MAWTDRQKQAIESRGSSLLVSAAAGSGKTSVLVERVKQLVLEEGVSLENMLIVTFTNAAAAEMKERIYESLSRQLSAEGQSKDRRNWLRTQMNLVGRANISTFHKFALEVVRRYYHVIGIKPNLAICDEARQAILSREALDELMEQCYEEDRPDFRAFLDRYATSKGDTPVRDLILNFHKFLQSLPDPWQWTEDLLTDPGQFEARYRAFAKAQTLRRLDLAIRYFRMAGDELEGIPKLQAKNEADLAYLYSLRALAEQGALAETAEALAGHRYTMMSASKDEKPDWELCKPRVTALRDNGKTHIKKAKERFLIFSEERLEKERVLSAEPLQTLVSLTKEFSSRYGAKKDLLGVLDFSDIEHFSLRILESEDVRKEYREKFDHIFIDEY